MDDPSPTDTATENTDQQEDGKHLAQKHLEYMDARWEETKKLHGASWLLALAAGWAVWNSNLHLVVFGYLRINIEPPVISKLYITVGVIFFFLYGLHPVRKYIRYRWGVSKDDYGL